MSEEKSRQRDRGEGRTYQRGNRWWVEYWHRGKQFRESAGKTEGEARKRLKARLKEIAGDRFVGPDEERRTVGELLDALLLHLETKGARSLRSYRYHANPVRGFFSLMRAVDLSTPLIERYVQERQQEGKANATVNRETGVLVQALNLARKQGRLTRVPYTPRLLEDNARQGFFEKCDFEAIAAKLPPHIADIARFAYLTGWRRGEILPLRWEAVDKEAREIRLRTSKNGRGRLLPLEGELLDLMERRWREREFQASGVTRISEYVFHRYGRSLVDIAKPWKKACEKAGLPGMLFHDFRRTAARDMVRAGVPERIAMSITGHVTRSMFDRYNIVSDEDMREAMRRTNERRSSQPTTRKVARFPSEPRR